MNRGSLQFGDIVLVKSFSVIGWAIGKSFYSDSPLTWYDGGESERARPSNHTGVLGYDGQCRLCVFEALGNGVVKTSLNDYANSVYNKESELKFARIAGIKWTNPMLANAELWLTSKLGVKYDFMSYVSHLWRTLLRLPPLIPRGIHSERRFYCTELVNGLYLYLNTFSPDNIDLDVFKNPLPTPFTVEKRVKSGALEIVEEWSNNKQ